MRFTVVALCACAVGCGLPGKSPGNSTTPPRDGGAPVSGAVQLPAALGGGAAVPSPAPSTPPSPSPMQPLHGRGAQPAPPGTPLDPPPVTASATLPASVDLSSQAPPAGDQGQVGACATFAAGYSAMGWWANHDGLAGATFAPMYLYSQIVKGDCSMGTWLGNVLAIMKAQGVDTQTDYEPMQYQLDCATPPTSAQQKNAGNFKITGYTDSDLTSGAKPVIMATLASGVPALLAINVYPEFENVTAQHYLVGPPQTGDGAGSGHSIAAFAYDENGVWILNSWGTSWGKNGWAQLSWDFVEGSFGGMPNVFEVAAITGVKFACKDSDASCGYWAFTQQCQANPSYMLGECCASCANPSPELPTASQWFRVQNQALGGAWSLDTGVIAASGDYSGQYWKLTPLGDGRYRLTNSYQGDGMSFDTTNMAATGSYTGQYWTLSPITDGVYRLSNDYLGSGTALAVDQARNVVSVAAGAYTSQYWTVTLIQ